MTNVHQFPSPLEQMMNEFHRQFHIAQTSEIKAGKARIKAGLLLKEMRQQVEANGDDWWPWFVDHSVRSRKDAEKLLRLVESDDPEAAAGEAAKANRDAVSRLRKREKEFPVERIQKLIGKLTPEQREEFEASRPQPVAAPPVAAPKLVNVPVQALAAQQSAENRKAAYAAEEEAGPAPAETAVLEAERSSAPTIPKGVTVTIDETWRAPLARMAEYLGVPADEYANFLMHLGGLVFGRKFQKGLSNDIAWWLIEMHSKYSDTFNVSSWEGSCGHLAIDRLYAERNVPVGKFQEWKAAGSPGMSKEEQERLQKALAVIRKRAKRLGLKLEGKSGAVTTYWLTDNSGSAGGSIETVGKMLDRVEAGLPMVDWEAVAANG
jgi:Spy/CpxP family protein refolding chaperone